VHRNGTTPQLAIVDSDAQVHRPSVDYDRLLSIGKDLLEAIGEDVTRPGIAETPRRFADWWREFIEYEPGNLGTSFESVSTNQMVVVSGMRVWSVCEHHLLPFWCDVSIGYIARDKVLGLSKFARIAHKYAHRPQIQERLVHQIADEVQSLSDSEDVAVLASGEHLCMTMRGIKTPAKMKSSVMRGAFYWNQSARAEFLQLIAE
jgi:GTP cyclohydrolase IA